jgi:hypothetical protein
VVVVGGLALIRAPVYYHAAVRVGFEVVDFVAGLATATLEVFDLGVEGVVVRHLGTFLMIWDLETYEAYQLSCLQ